VRCSTDRRGRADKLPARGSACLRAEGFRLRARLKALVLSALIFAVFAGFAAYSARSALYSGSVSGRIAVGVTVRRGTPEESAVEMVSSMSSVSELCDFSYVTEDEGELALKSGKLSVLIILEPGELESINSGYNRRIKLQLHGASPVEAGLFMDLAGAAVKLIGSAEAGIYSAEDYLVDSGRRDLIPQVELDLNQIYDTNGLTRLSLFDISQTDASEGMGLDIYYFLSALLLLLLCEGIAAAGFFAEPDRAASGALRRAGYTGARISMSRLAVFSLYLFAAGAVFTALAGLFVYIPFSFSLAAALMLDSVLAAALAQAVYSLAGSGLPGTLIWCAVTILLFLLSGGILPLVFFPAALRGPLSFSPFHLMQSLTGNAMYSIDTASYALPVLCWAAAAVGLTLTSEAIVRRRRMI
jgi:hypothetical protein